MVLLASVILLLFLLVVTKVIVNILTIPCYPFGWKQELKNIKQKKYTKGNFQHLWVQYQHYTSTDGEVVYFVDDEALKLPDGSYIHNPAVSSISLDPYYWYVWNQFNSYFQQEHPEIWDDEAGVFPGDEFRRMITQNRKE